MRHHGRPTPAGVDYPISTQCILEDNFGDNVGSTLGWDGSVRALDGAGRYIFDNTSSTVARLSSEYTTVYPCYSSSTDSTTGEERVVSGNPYHTFSTSDDDYGVAACAYTWLSKGASVRAYCLDAAETQPSALQLYAAATHSVNTTADLLDSYFGCSTLEAFQAEALSNVYVRSELALDRHVGNYYNGVFIPVRDEQAFLVESHRVSTLLFAHKFVDSRRTRTFRLNMILRNVERSSMFYTILHCDIKVNPNGHVLPSFTMTHVPIIQYVYGSGKYPWRFRQVVAMESIMLFFFGLFFLRELKQITVRLLKVWKKIQARRKVPVLPVQSTSGVERAESEVAPRLRPLPSLNLTNISDPEKGMVDTEDNNDRESVSVNVVNQTSAVDSVPSDRQESFVDPDEGSFVYDLVDWTTIACFILAIIFRVLYVNEAVALHFRIKTGLVDDTVDEKLDGIINQFDCLENVSRRTNFLALFLCFVGFAQFFRYLSFDKRLGIVTKTMKDSFVDLLPVMLIYCFILIAYGILGTSLYGHESQYFKSLSDSLTTLSLIVLGEVAGPYYEMHAIAAFETVLFYWSFVILIGFVLLNMVLAVIFKVYDDTYCAISESEKKDA